MPQSVALSRPQRRSPRHSGRRARSLAGRVSAIQAPAPAKHRPSEVATPRDRIPSGTANATSVQTTRRSDSGIITAPTLGRAQLTGSEAGSFIRPTCGFNSRCAHHPLRQVSRRRDKASPLDASVTCMIHRDGRCGGPRPPRPPSQPRPHVGLIFAGRFSVLVTSLAPLGFFAAGGWRVCSTARSS